MKASRVYSVILVVVFFCALMAGCRPEVQAPEGPETGLVAEEKVLSPQPAVEKQQLQEQKPAESPKTTQQQAASTTTTTKTSTETRKAQPRISFAKTVHDFGEIGPGSRSTCEFKFTNVGNAVLKIDRIQSTCGCTVPKLSKREYAPGESGTITVTYHASRWGGKVGKTIYVFSNDPQNSKVGLHIKGIIVQKVRYSPQQLKLFLKKDISDVPRITLTAVDDVPFAIKSFEATGGAITAAFDPSEKKTEFVLEPKLDYEKLARYLRGSIRIGLTHPQCDMVAVPYTVLPRFETNPRAILVRNAEPGKPVIRKNVWVLNNYGEDFEIVSTSSDKGLIKVLSLEKVEKKNRYKLEIEITPPEMEKKRSLFTDALRIKTKTGDEIKIDCRGFYSRK